MKLKLYPQLFSSLSPSVMEEKSFFPSLTERHLQVIWLEQKSLKPLKTIQGEIIEVISPGIWNMGTGPDFLKAHLRIGQKDYRGDIEIHLHDGGWYQHGHHQDSRYNHVILHLSFWCSPQPLLINKENGQQAFSCFLGESLTVPLEQLMLQIDFDHYPSKQFSSKGRCAESLFTLLSEAEIKNLFQSAAYWRLERKLNYLEQSNPSRPLQFVGGIAMALGYKHNARSFLDLFLYLMHYRDLPYEELLAIALGCCGFLEEGRKTDWEPSDYYQYLRQLWWGRKDQMTHQAHLKLDRIRPFHHPIRRLAYLAHLLQDAHLEQLWSKALQKWQAAMEASTPPRLLEEELLQVLPLYRDPYWDYHFTFEGRTQSKCLPSLGKELKMHVLLNTTLPLLYAIIKESGDFQQWERFQQFYASLEVSHNSKSRYLHQRFFGDQRESELLTKAQMVQGAFQLHQDFCAHFESSCKGCPFVERYQAQM
jgi:hypothetical protein